MRDKIYRYSLLNAAEHGGKASPQAVLGKLIAHDPSIKPMIGRLMGEIQKIVEEVNSLSLDEQKDKIEKLGIENIEKVVKPQRGLPELKNVEKGNVVMRLAPYPSGPLHIGNARMVILNDEYVKKYKGKLYLMFDDTIGSEEKFIIPEAYKMIPKSLKWLGVKYKKSFYKSDRLKIFYKVATELINKDVAYVCECDAQTLRNNRVNGTACIHRIQTADENLKKWDMMIKGKYDEGKVVVRLKTDMQHPNPAFRDRVLLRVAKRKHPRVGMKYKVWPMLEFSWAVDDHILGITHILRGKDLIIEDMMEEYIWDIMGWKKPEILHYGILNLEGVKLSKTESRKMMKRKIYKGWDDPRVWSMQSLEKRGIHPKAIRNFIIGMGMSLSDVNVPVEILYSENRKLIDTKSNRYFCVIDPVVISIDSKIKSSKSLLHPDFPKRGKKIIPLNTKRIYVDRNDFDKLKGSEVGLMNLFSIKLDKKSEITSNDVKYEIQKIHWVSEPNVKIKIVMPDGDIIKAIAEPGVKKLKIGSIVQFPRIGFARLDKNMTFYFAHK